MVWVLLSGLGCGCSSWEGDRLYDTGDSGCWALENPVVVSSEIDASSIRPQVYINFGQDYPYMNLQMSLRWTGPSGQEDRYDFQSTVVDPAGDWLIDAEGASYPLILTLKDSIVIPEPGRWTFTLSHNMREEQICQIRQVGIRLEME